MCALYLHTTRYLVPVGPVSDSLLKPPTLIAPLAHALVSVGVQPGEQHELLVVGSLALPHVGRERPEPVALGPGLEVALVEGIVGH